MNTVDQILDRVRQLDPEKQQLVLHFIEQLDRPLSAQALMQLPPEDRDRHVQAAIAASSEEDFETFEAYSEENHIDP